MEISEKAVKALIKRKLTLSSAESCTGGMIGKCITSVPGASEVYGFGFITYANEAKEKLLGVKHETLEKYGAVSRETAIEMSEGARRVSGADIAVSVTGIAGPGGGSPKKPVGLVYISLSAKDTAIVKKLLLHGTREEIRQSACENIFNLILENL